MASPSVGCTTPLLTAISWQCGLTIVSRSGPIFLRKVTAPHSSMPYRDFTIIRYFCQESVEIARRASLLRGGMADSSN